MVDMDVSKTEVQRLIAAGTNQCFQHSVTVKALPGRVWDIWMDVANWSTWDHLIDESSSLEPLKLGARGIIVPKKGLPSKFEIVTFEPHVKWALEASIITTKLRITRSLTTQGEFTTFTHKVEFSGFASTIFASFLGPGFRVALPEVMRQIAAQAVLPSRIGST
jgi:Polyketide cyclase / dehydrase and lipid transport